MAAPTKPNTISCACHKVGGQLVPRGTPNTQIATHAGISANAANPAKRKVGRNPLANNRLRILVSSNIPRPGGHASV